MVAAHPVPDDNSVLAGQAVLDAVKDLTRDDLVIALISGGGSALLVAPIEGVSLSVKQQLNQDLLRAGANITEMNCVRKHVSRIKGGGLAKACYPAKLVTLLISDVPNDDVCVIASGPTQLDTTTSNDAQAILQRYGIDFPYDLQETPKEAHYFANTETQLIATPNRALLAAASLAESNAQGFTTQILGDSLEGEAREMGRVLAGIATYAAHTKKQHIILSGGESTVTLNNKSGRGGRNVEFLLSLLIALNGHSRIYALAGDTDGVDGVEEVAGAYITPQTLAKAQALGLNPQHYLDRNDAHTFFQLLGQQVITGATFTNVNDFRAILID
jgi:glycerate 2-kinase